MQNPFLPVVNELKNLRANLNQCTYNAVFGETTQQRQTATNKAIEVEHRIKDVLTSTWEAAEQVTSFVRSPHRGGILLTVNALIEEVEAGSQKMQAGSTPSLPEAPASREVSL